MLSLDIELKIKILSSLEYEKFKIFTEKMLFESGQPPEYLMTCADLLVILFSTVNNGEFLTDPETGCEYVTSCNGKEASPVWYILEVTEPLKARFQPCFEVGLDL